MEGSSKAVFWIMAAKKKPISFNLDISLREDSVSLDHWAANTFRRDGISISTQKTRILGRDIPMEVSFDDLIVGARIGRGACSSVHVATHRTTRQNFAVKVRQSGQSYPPVHPIASKSLPRVPNEQNAFHHPSHHAICQSVPTFSVNAPYILDVQYL